MNRWLVVLGMVLIVGMLVIAAFAVGVYVGEHGWTRAGLRYQPGGQPPPPGRVPPGDQIPPRVAPPPKRDSPPAQAGIPGLPPGPPQIVGRLQEKSIETLVLATRDGPRRVALTPETRLLNDAGGDLTLEELQAGDVLGVFGRYDPAAGEFQADIVLRLPPKP